MKTVGLTKFVMRQTESNFAGTQVSGEQLEILVNIATEMMNSSMPGMIKDGNDPWVKIATIYPSHPRVPDELDTIKYPVVEITQENEPLLLTGYKARQDGEFPVLSRWFHPYAGGDHRVEGISPHHVDVILYTKEQLVAEGKKSGMPDYSGADFDVVSVNAEMEEKVPMLPITLLRNALGKEYGGSGAELDPKTYAKAVEFWHRHAMIG